ncbi:hypothetical protein HanPI659440_Chr10g0392801 [Helianthus annuus]|uniref:Uncharacterized protein n=1 Tax=Helianthus annuus TaxID=4232 RepID=A0A251T468_HELAN|nr:hypothetical protein HanXRQr2_Chr12g0544361 [Helianthus annuus]KAJ0523340.1 hypothetical protein HanIR_Chr10g0492711 [Helianthus annuus]KAJ0531156.1 hypothetical protein HanHA89_Chr10g0397991 [Helianthus annuus]KAJ0675181.1 hypothetical protein HanLR1_Chr12g0448321 [Helianthus annuus]KAJ0744896.1 hypothetical protein HanPI659440_Chr10g0392801 [Helianthus annuus]
MWKRKKTSVEIDYYYMTKVMDTFYDQARSGKDVQVIPWGKFNIISESYRRT